MPYDDGFDGLQYYGKGGTNPFNPSHKKKQNVKKQGKIMEAATSGVKIKPPGLAGYLGHTIKDPTSIMNPQVMGMMYWTTTGLFESIEKRNDKMWGDTSVGKLKTLWNQGLGDFIAARDPHSHHPRSVNYLKQFIPNIIMIDFANKEHCRTIYGLNKTPDEAFIEVIRRIEAEEDL